MQMDLQLLLILILFGFLAAFIDSVVGGGGLIALPALLFLGLNPTTAIATSKLASTIGLSTSTISFYRSGKIDFHSVKKIFSIGIFRLYVWCLDRHINQSRVIKTIDAIYARCYCCLYHFQKRLG